MKIEANFQRRGNWKSGTIMRDNKNGTYDIYYDDHEDESNVNGLYIRAKASSSMQQSLRSPPRSTASSGFAKGAKIEANLNGRGKWVNGTILFLRDGGTYDNLNSELKELKSVPRLNRVLFMLRAPYPSERAPKSRETIVVVANGILEL